MTKTHAWNTEQETTIANNAIDAVELTDAELAVVNGAGGCHHGCHSHHDQGLLNLKLKLKLKVNLDDLLGDDC